MNKADTNSYGYIRSLVATIACLLMLAAIAPRHGAAADSKPAPAERCVMLLSVDGLADFYFADPKAKMPTIRKLAAEGVRARGMKASVPTVTWPNHTTLVTGVHPARHGVVGNNYLDRATGNPVTLIWDPVLDKDEVVRVPTIYDLAKQQGMTTASVRWPATRNAKSLDYTTPDVGLLDLVRGLTTPCVLDSCRKAGIEIASAGRPRDEVEATDAQWNQVMLDILREFRPELALHHLVHVDHVEHAEGPRSREAYAAIEAADEQVGQIWEQMQRLYPDGATIFLVSDHGFSPIERIVLPNVVLRSAGISKGGEADDANVKVVVQGGAAMIYVLDDARREELIKNIKAAFAEIEGVSKIIDVKDFPAYGLADPQVDPRSPDVVLFAGLGFAFGDTASGDIPYEIKPERKGTHGHDPNLPELEATFIACGAGIKQGVEIDGVNNTDVAPTIAKLLGLELAQPDGKVIEAALAP
jgi:predicted AlkP superfamily pyrophosphatase or phosphodiesterase